MPHPTQLDDELVATRTPECQAGVLVARRHHLLVRCSHWLNLPILLGLVLSGMSIYWASPVYRHKPDPTLAAELWNWKHNSSYAQPEDWDFASPHTEGRNPYWPDIVLSRVIRPAAARAGIRKHIGWHTFRRSFSTLLIANGENVKVVQELMRLANCRCTLENYSQARIQEKREAQRRVVEMIFSHEHESGRSAEVLAAAKGNAADGVLV